MAIVKNCVICKKEFKARAERVKTCSKICGGATLKVVKKCLYCNTEFFSQRKRTLFCSMPCFHANKSVGKLINCTICNTEFVPTKRQKSSVCSQECRKIKTRRDKVLHVTKIENGASVTHTVDIKKLSTIEKETLKTIKRLEKEIEENGHFNQYEIFTEKQIENIFNLILINEMDIDDDVTCFSLKKYK